MNVSLATAQTDYPDAWASIHKRMDEVRDQTDATMIPMSARIVEQDGVASLELKVMTDLKPEGSDVSAMPMCFRSPLAPRPALRLLN